MPKKKKISIIFLDIDGVMNSQRFYTKYTPKELLSIRDEWGDAFDPESKKLLNKLIDETGAKVVIISTWRSSGLEDMQRMWEARGMNGEVVGITPHIGIARSHNKYNVSVPRGIEVKWYYENRHNFHHWTFEAPFVDAVKRKCTLKSYLILDDDSDFLLEQGDNIVLCKSTGNGFYNDEYYKSLAILRNKIG